MRASVLKQLCFDDASCKLDKVAVFDNAVTCYVCIVNLSIAEFNDVNQISCKCDNVCICYHAVKVNVTHIGGIEKLECKRVIAYAVLCTASCGGHVGIVPVVLIVLKGDCMLTGCQKYIQMGTELEVVLYTWEYHCADVNTVNVYGADTAVLTACWVAVIVVNSAELILAVHRNIDASAPQ